MRAHLAQSYAYCRKLTRKRARNFYWAFILLDRPRHDALCALYAFNRVCDDLVDEPERWGARPGAEALARWAEALSAALEGRYDSNPIWPALHDTVQRYQIPREYLFAMIEGMQADLHHRQPKDFAELYAYCYRVASVVGMSLLHVLGYRTPEAITYAEYCGVAFQLTNIIRDVGEDARRGRIYLPADELCAFQVAPADLTAPEPSPALRRLLQFQAQRAWGYYQAAAPLLDQVTPRCRPALSALIDIYAELLREIERRDYRVLAERIELPATRKLAVLIRNALHRSAQLRRPAG